MPGPDPEPVALTLEPQMKAEDQLETQPPQWRRRSRRTLRLGRYSGTNLPQRRLDGDRNRDRPLEECL
ncbi:hypothetical protein NDU88_003099 [Pleurodeles waltl]|uniref:Uncharacterized protein n=1 Tax=Pleurodeles waltl TaxID=8319 RepID=A0AAV7W166_PLEWA|nr:hypothetical protein NDU88_003099 [Pleurodeles waltl]